MSAGLLRRALREALVLPIRVYRRVLSPLKPPSCRFSPTCSAYAEQALRVHGLARGMLLASWRILRCQPFCAGGHDPVPDAHSPWFPLPRCGRPD